MLLCNFKLLFVIENGHNFGESLSENEEGGLPLSINSGPIVFGIAKQQIENHELHSLLSTSLIAGTTEGVPGQAAVRAQV